MATVGVHCEGGDRTIDVPAETEDLSPHPAISEFKCNT